MVALPRLFSFCGVCIFLFVLMPFLAASKVKILPLNILNQSGGDRVVVYILFCVGNSCWVLV